MPEMAPGRRPEAGRHPARAEPVRRLAQRSGHRAHRVLGDRGDERDRQDPTARPAARIVNAGASGKMPWTILGLMNVRAKNPEDDAGDAGQDLEDRLDDVTHRGVAYSDR